MDVEVEGNFQQGELKATEGISKVTNPHIQVLSNICD